MNKLKKHKRVLLSMSSQNNGFVLIILLIFVYFIFSGCKQQGKNISDTSREILQNAPQLQDNNKDNSNIKPSREQAIKGGNIAAQEEKIDNFVLVEGGIFKNTKSIYYGYGVTIPSFYIGKFEVTQKEWSEVMGSNPSQFKGDNLPVETVSWYDCVEYCNKRSVKEGLKPYYNIDKNNKDTENKNDIDDIKWTVTTNEGANGYRLPTEAEWEYAAGGGQMSKSYICSGSDDVNQVAWYWRNSGDEYLTGFWSWPVIEKNNNKTKPVGGKKPNELGLYDTSGNVREWCWDWHEGYGPEDPQGRVWRGGGWLGGEHCCESSFRGKFEANGLGPDQGLRLCRSK